MTREHGSATPGTGGSENTMAALERRLQEACDELWNRFVDPMDAYLDDDGLPWIPLGDGPATYQPPRPPLVTEQDLALIRAQCRVLAVGNEFAINGHENRVNYIVGSGHSYRATLKKHASAPQELAARVQAVLERFLRANRWHRRQQELVRRCDRDGEAFIRFFPVADGGMQLRFIEPDQVRTPPELVDDPAAAFGILTDRDDVETVRGYYVDGTFVPAEEIQHRKANVDFNVRRGLPLFYPVRKNLRRAERLLRNMSVVAEIQSAIALIRKHRNSTRTATQQFISQQADATVSNPATGKTSFFKRYAPGTILDAHADVDYEIPATALDAGSYVTVLQAELRAIASRLVMPEFMLTSDASNANYASTMVAEGPAVRMFQRLQAQQIEDDLVIMRRVVENACRTGHLEREALVDIEIQAVPPSLAVRDMLQTSQALLIEFEAGILSPQTWSQLAGLDYDQEQTNLAAAPRKQPQQ